MSFLRNLLALIGLVTVIALIIGALTIGPKITQLHPEAPGIYAEAAQTLLETGDPAVAMVWSVPAEPGLTGEDVVESLKSLATSESLFFAGESPFYRQVEAVTGEPFGYANFLSFCDAQVGKMMIEYRGEYSGFMPCRVAVVEGPDGNITLYAMNMDMMIYGGSGLPAELEERALSVRDKIKKIMVGAAAGEF